MPIGEHRLLQIGRFLGCGRDVIAGEIGVRLDADGRELVGLLVGFPAPTSGPLIARFGILPDKRADHVHLLAARQRLARRIVSPALIGLRHDVRGAAGRVVGTVLDVGQRHIAEHRQRERTGNGRGRQVERIGGFALGKERRALLHAEALLLVDDRERETLEANIGLEQRVRADEHADAAVGCAFKQAGSLVIGRGTREQAPGDAHFVEPLPQRRGMLAREHLGRRHERRLGARVGHRGKGERRNGGLARAHVAEQHMVGRLGRRHAREDIRTSLLLLRGKGERHDTVERRRARAVHHMRHRLRAGGALRGLRHEGELEQQQLLVHQATTRLGNLFHSMREVDAR